MTGKPSKSTPSISDDPKPLVRGLPWAVALTLYELVCFGAKPWWWRLHWAVWKGFRGLDPGACIQVRRGDNPGELAYGETPALSFFRLVSWAELNPGASILDLGSGRGLVPMMAALTEFRAAGIEVVEEYVCRAREVASKLELEVDFRAVDMLECEWPQADLLLVNSTAFGSSFRRELAVRLCKLDSETKVATYDWELDAEQFSELASGRLPVTWGTVLARVYRKI